MTPSISEIEKTGGMIVTYEPENWDSWSNHYLWMHRQFGTWSLGNKIQFLGLLIVWHQWVADWQSPVTERPVWFQVTSLSLWDNKPSDTFITLNQLFGSRLPKRESNVFHLDFNLALVPVLALWSIHALIQLTHSQIKHLKPGIVQNALHVPMHFIFSTDFWSRC